MQKWFLVVFIGALALNSWAQRTNSSQISEMEWGADFKLHVKFSNDSTTIHDIKGLYHSTSADYANSGQVTYYPVMLDNAFVEALKDREIDSFVDSAQTMAQQQQKMKTLWSALHYQIGGGFIHFVNCLVYTFESGNLSLTAPLMKRPHSDWKPKPMTESYKRTQKWEYYAPVNQELAQKEYKLKLKKNQLGDLALLPSAFTQMFLTTNQKAYDALLLQKKTHELAIIDMVKLLVGANYLGQEQIDYIQASVLKAVMQYNANNLPSVIIFDDFDAAVAMTLTGDGYKIDKIVFNNELDIAPEAMNQRIERMEGIIKQINETNKKVFEKNLKSYYQ